MKWPALALVGLMAFATPAALAASCFSATPSADSSVSCGCCADGGSCCVKAPKSNQAPLKASAVVASVLQPPTAPPFQIESYFAYRAPSLIYRPASPDQFVRPPPDSVRLCRFLI